jgi:hypothetical protein
VRSDGDDGDHKRQNGGEHDGDVDRSAVFSFWRGLGDAEEVDETGGDEAEKSHVYRMMAWREKICYRTNYLDEAPVFRGESDSCVMHLLDCVDAPSVEACSELAGSIHLN